MNEISIESRFPISLEYTVKSHGWARLAPWHWDTEKCELSRPEWLETCGLITLKVNQLDTRTFGIKVDGAKLDHSGQETILRIVQRWLSLDWNPGSAISSAMKIDVRVAEFINLGGGRFLRCSTFYEDFVKTICTINTNWASTIRMVALLVDDIGHGVFPTPSMVAECGENFLRKQIRLGFRSPVLANATAELLSRKIIDGQGNLKVSRLSYEDLLGIRGIGPYSASHIGMLQHDFSNIPIDSEVSNYCKQQFGIEPKDAKAFFDIWGDYRFLGYKLTRMLNHKNWIG